MSTNGSRDEGFHLIDHAGKTGIFHVRGMETVATARYGPKAALNADVVMISGDDARVFTDVLILDQLPMSQLKPYPGQKVVARVALYDTRSGDQAPKLVEPGAEAIAAAAAYRTRTE